MKSPDHDGIQWLDDAVERQIENLEMLTDGFIHVDVTALGERSTEKPVARPWWARPILQSLTDAQSPIVPPQKGLLRGRKS